MYLQEVKEYELKHLHLLKIVALIHSLRRSLAPLLEAMLLVDRYVYLKYDHDLRETFLIPIFSKYKSPRNVALVSLNV